MKKSSFRGYYKQKTAFYRKRLASEFIGKTKSDTSKKEYLSLTFEEVKTE